MAHFYPCSRASCKRRNHKGWRSTALALYVWPWVTSLWATALGGQSDLPDTNIYTTLFQLPQKNQFLYFHKENNQHNSITSFKRNPNGKAYQPSKVFVCSAAAKARLAWVLVLVSHHHPLMNTPNSQTSKKDWQYN